MRGEALKDVQEKANDMLRQLPPPQSVLTPTAHTPEDTLVLETWCWLWLCMEALKPPCWTMRHVRTMKKKQQRWLRSKLAKHPTVDAESVNKRNSLMLGHYRADLCPLICWFSLYVLIFLLTSGFLTSNAAELLLPKGKKDWWYQSNASLDTFCLVFVASRHAALAMLDFTTSCLSD